MPCRPALYRWSRRTLRPRPPCSASHLLPRFTPLLSRVAAVAAVVPSSPPSLRHAPREAKPIGSLAASSSSSQAEESNRGLLETRPRPRHCSASAERRRSFPGDSRPPLRRRPRLLARVSTDPPYSLSPRPSSLLPPSDFGHRRRQHRQHAVTASRPEHRPEPASRPVVSDGGPALTPAWAGHEAGLFGQCPGLAPGLGRL